MPPDANSRTILRVCAASLILLATWLHGNGKGFERGQSQCAMRSLPVEQARHDRAQSTFRTSPTVALQ